MSGDRGRMGGGETRQSLVRLPGRVRNPRVCLKVVKCADAGVSACAGEGGHQGERGKVSSAWRWGRSGEYGVSASSGACVAGDPGRGGRECLCARAWGVCT